MANSAARSSIDVGSIIAGTYTIEALIGRGGMGAVFMASHARLPGKQVAIKVLHADLIDDEVLARFRREAEIASRLGHPNIVTVHDFNALPDGTPYLVLEYLEGENLAQRIKRGPMQLAEVVAIARQIGSALAAAHREGIVHRDLKPANVYLVPTEVAGAQVEQVKVLDFGISKIRGSTTVKTQESAMLGTPQYMAPEQALGNHAEVDDRTDIFALGSIIYEMLCGQPAFVGASVPEVVFKVVYEDPAPLAERAIGVAPAVAAAVHRALAKAQDARFATVSELIVALTGEPISVMRTARPASGSLPPGDPHVASAAALANTVGSGDHGAPPIAIAETQASGDHGGGRPALGAGAPAPAPAARRLWPIIAAVVAVLAIGGGVIAGLDGRDAAAPGPTTDAAAVAATAATTADAAPIAMVEPADAVPVAVIVAVDAAPAPIAKPTPRTARPRPDAAVADVAVDPGPIDPNKRTPQQLFREGLRTLASDPGRVAQLGRRLTDAHGDPRGWVLRGAAACRMKKLADINVAEDQLAGRPKLLAQMRALCGGARRRGRP